MRMSNWQREQNGPKATSGRFVSGEKLFGGNVNLIPIKKLVVIENIVYQFLFSFATLYAKEENNNNLPW